MKLIPLEEVIKLLNEHPSSNTNKIIQSLHDPIDPIATIDEMIEERKYIREQHGVGPEKLAEELVLEEALSRIEKETGGETLEDIIEDIGKRMCHAGLLYPNAGYWTLQDKWGWECKGETLIDVYKEFREELKRNGHYD